MAKVYTRAQLNAMKNNKNEEDELDTVSVSNSVPKKKKVYSRAQLNAIKNNGGFQDFNINGNQYRHSSAADIAPATRTAPEIEMALNKATGNSDYVRNTIAKNSNKAMAGNDSTTQPSFIEKAKAVAKLEMEHPTSALSKFTTMMDIKSGRNRANEQTVEAGVDRATNKMLELDEKYNVDALENMDASKKYDNASFINKTIQRNKYKKHLMDKYKMTEEDADMYINYSDYMNETSENQKANERAYNYQKNEANAGEILGSSDMEWVTKSLAGIRASKEAAEKMLGVGVYKDKDMPINIYSDDYQMQNLNQSLIQGNKENIESKYGKVASEAYSVGNTIAENLVNALFADLVGTGIGKLAGTASNAMGKAVDSANVADKAKEIVGLAPFFNIGLSSGIKEAKERGASDAQAITYGTLAGSVEVATEKLPFDSLNNIIFGDGGKNILKSIFKQSLAEGGEEATADVLDYLADITINRDKSELQQMVNDFESNGDSKETAYRKAVTEMLKQTLYDGLVGALSGGGSATVGSGINQTMRTSAGRDLVSSSQNTNDTLSYINGFENADALKEQVLSARGKQQGGQLKGKEARALYDAIAEASKTHSDNSVNAVNQATNEEELNSAIDSIPRSLVGSEEVYKAIQTKSNEIMPEVDTTPAEAYNNAKEGKVLPSEIKNAKSEEVKKSIANGLSELSTKLTRFDASTLLEKKGNKAKQVTITNEVSMRDDVYYVKTAEGKEIALTPESEELKDNAKAQLLFFGDKSEGGNVNGFLSLENPKLVSVALDAKQNSDATMNSIYTAVQTFSRLGATNVSFDKALAYNSYMAETVDKSLLQQAYNIGVEESKAADVRKAEAKSVYPSDTVGLTEDASNSLKKYSKATETLVSTLSNKLGVEISIDALKEGNRGYFDGNNKIVLNSDNMDETIQTVFHEGIGEVMQRYNPKGAKNIQDTMLKYLEDKLGSKDFTSTVEEYQKAYRADAEEGSVDFNKSYREAANEMVNDTMFALFMSEEGMNDLLQWCDESMTETQRKSFLEKLKDFWNDLIQHISELLKSGNFNKAEKAALEMEKSQAEKMRQMVLDAMDVAIENKNSEQAKSENKGSADVSDNRFSKEIKQNLSTKEEELILSQLFQKENTKKNTTFKTADGKIGIRDNRSIYVVDKMDDTDDGFMLERIYDVDFKESNVTETSIILEGIEDYESNKNKTSFECFISTYFTVRRPHLQSKESVRYYDFYNGRRNTEFYIGKSGKVLSRSIKSNRNDTSRRRNFSQNEGYNDNSSQITRKSIKVNSEGNISKIKGIETSLSGDANDEIFGVTITNENELSNDEFDRIAEAYRNTTGENKIGINFVSGNYLKETVAKEGKIYLDSYKNDIRYPILKEIGVMFDSEGTQLTKEQLEYFKNSKIVDSNGRLKVVYHGTENKFTVFKPKEFGDKNGHQEGYGIYLSDDKEIFETYGSENGIKGYVNIENPASAREKTLSIPKIKKIIKQSCNYEAAQMLDDGYDSVNDAIKDTWISNYVDTYSMSIENAISEVAKTIRDNESNDADIIYEIMNGFGVNDFESAYDFYDNVLIKASDIDGFITVWTDNKTGEESEVIVALNSNQIKDISNKKPTKNEDIRKSIKVDTEGNKLTEGQQKYFKNSKVVDEEGNLKVMYHGTNAEFTEFDPKKIASYGHYGRGFYFADTKSYSSTYGKTFEVYLNLTNPLITTGKTLTREQITDLVTAVAEDEDYGIENYGYDATIKTVVDSLMEHETDFLMLTDLNAACVGDMVGLLKLANDTIGTTYDGIIVDTETVAFYPEQIKLTSNENPTSDKDVRKSIKVDTEGNKLTKDQQKFYEDESEELLVDGKLEVMYHGTSSGGFYEFDNDYNSNGVVGSFFTNDMEVAKGYSGTHNIFAPKNFSTVEEVNNAIKGIYNRYSVKETEGGYGLFYMDETEPEEVEENLNDIFDKFLEYTGEGGMIYKSYLHATNPYIVDAKGSDWDNLPGINGKEPATTNDYAAYAKENGYDAVIFKNLYDIGLYSSSKEYKASKVVAVFSPNQVKSIYNDKPTEDSDIRYSKSVKDAQNSYKLYGEASQYADSINEVQVFTKLLGNMNKALGDVELNPRQIYSVATKIVGKYNLDINERDELHMQIARVVNQLNKKNLEADYDNIVNYLLNIGDEVIAKSNVKDPQQVELFADVKKLVGSYNIKLTDENKAELKNLYGSNYMSVLWGAGFKISKEGSSLDSVWSEFRDEFAKVSGQNLSYNINDLDEFEEVIDTVKALAPNKTNFEGASALDKSLMVAGDIIDAYYTLAEKKLEKKVERDAVRKAKDSLRRDLDRYKETKEAMFDSEVKSLVKQLNEQNEQNRQIALNGWGEKTKYRILTDKQIKERARVQALKRINSYQESQEKAKQIDNIKKTASRLIKWLDNPTEKQHVPHFLEKPLAEFINSFDFLSERAKADSNNTLDWQMKMNNLKDVLVRINDAELKGERSSEAYFAQSIIASELIDRLDTVLGKFKFDEFTKSNIPVNRKATKISNLSASDLKALSEVMSSLSTAINKMNETYANDRYKDLDELANVSFNEIDSLPKSKDRTKYGDMAYGFFELDESEPLTYFEYLGDAATSIYTELRKGFDVKIEHVRDTAAYMDDVKAELGLTDKDIKKWKDEIYEFELEKKIVKLNIPQIMSLYETMKREQGKMHVLLGGIKPASIEYKVKGKLLKRNTNNIKPVHLTEQMYKDIVSKLTDEQKAIADAMQYYMATECSKWGNRVSEEMFGYKKYLEEDYFPLKTDNNSRDVRPSSDNTVSYYNIKNSGFTKAITPNASNAILLDDIFDVFTNHVVSMAEYDGYVMPIADAMRWLNHSDRYMEKDMYNTVTEVGTIHNIREAINSVFGGDKGEQYFRQFIKDINGDTIGKGDGTELTNELMSMYKAQAVGFNLRVIIQQPTAVIRATNRISSKYLLGAQLSLPQALKYAEKAQKNSTIAYWKAQGYFETMLGESLKGIITGEESFRDKLNNIAGWGAGKADDLSWGIIYRAAELKVSDTRKDLEYDSPEYTREVVKVFEDIIDHTQVVDTLFHKSQIMRSKGQATKALTAFMAEPTKSYNMFLRAKHDSIKGNYRPVFNELIRRTTLIFLVEQIVNAAFQSIIDASRDDEKLSWLESFKENWIENTKDNINPLNMFPLIKEVTNAIKGYDATNYSTESIYTAVNTCTEIFKMIKGTSTKTGYGKAYQLAQAVSQVTGVPFANATREVKTIHNMIADFLGGSRWVTTQSKEQSLEKKKDNARTAEIYDKAFENGDISLIKDNMRTTYDKKLAETEDESKAWTAVRDELKTQFVRQYQEGTIDKTRLKNNYSTLLGNTKMKGNKGYRVLSDKEVASKIQGWIEAAEKEEPEE